MAIKDQVNQELNSTELGKTIWKYRLPIGGALVAILIFVISMAISSYRAEKAYQNFGGVVYDFTKKEFASLKEKKMDAAKYVESFNQLAEETNDYLGLAPLIMESSDVLLMQGKMKEAATLLEKGEKEFLGENDYLDSLLLARIAAVSENLGNDSKAIWALEKLVKMPQKILEGKVYLDLGRLYSKTGKKDKAKASFKYVVDKIKDKDFNKLAKIYLQELQATN